MEQTRVKIEDLKSLLDSNVSMSSLLKQILPG
jgi:hypothetical protein